MTDISQFPAGRIASGRRWGKAGVPLSEKDAEAAGKARATAANKQKLCAEADQRAHAIPHIDDRATWDGPGRNQAGSIEHARREWLAGRVVPHRITQALDIRNLDGPEVDWACGVEEPAVDEWEQGVRYPTWEQLLKLAELTDFEPWFFMRPVRHIITPADTSMPFHCDRHRDGEPCLRSRPAVFGGYMFDPEAIRRTLGGSR